MLLMDAIATSRSQLVHLGVVDLVFCRHARVSNQPLGRRTGIGDCGSRHGTPMSSLAAVCTDNACVSKRSFASVFYDHNGRSYGAETRPGRASGRLRSRTRASGLLSAKWLKSGHLEQVGRHLPVTEGSLTLKGRRNTAQPKNGPMELIRQRSSRHRKGRLIGSGGTKL
ncbi:hypothetical protein CUJ84_pRLN4000008 (plasmid) [Rhizobium leguminosarum]|uniref:Uncharacterized protein n=1 Tax=Rhizobium leguminosarum TaxID=384 RepID=A0A2K9ZHR8_RHILE|nr:hypothetical protein CUJ84_pRLN4000008 [Rhizobium leguminosarum]